MVTQFVAKALIEKVAGAYSYLHARMHVRIMEKMSKSKTKLKEIEDSEHKKYCKLLYLKNI